MDAREDLQGLKEGEGKGLFRSYRELVRLRQRHDATATPNLEVLMTHNAHRMITFLRTKGPERYLVVATLSNTGWPEGYELRVANLPKGRWREIFTSDAIEYNGSGVTNEKSDLEASNGTLTLKVPPRGFVVLRRTPVS